MMSMSYKTELKARILLAIAYTSQFEYPLTSSEIFQRLPLDDKEYYDWGDFIEEIVWLYENGILDYDRGLWLLRGSKASFYTRIGRLNDSEQKMQEIRFMIGLFKMLPWVKGVALTGSVSMNNAVKNDDVDFMIVVSPKRLWLSRPIITAFAWLSGKRRSWHREENNSWCFNLWLDTDHLSMPLNKRNIYTAYEVFQARWLFSKDGLSDEFYRANSWASRFLPHHDQFWSHQKIVSYDLPNFLGGILDIADWLFYKIQLWYMKPHRTVEKVGRGFAFFHPRDTRKQIMSAWNDIIQSNAGR